MKFWSNSDVPSDNANVPEKRLLAAVLQRAITDFLGGDGEISAGAYAWIAEKKQSDSPLTFSFICEALDLDCEGLRKAIISQRSDLPELSDESDETDCEDEETDENSFCQLKSREQATGSRSSQFSTTGSASSLRNSDALRDFV
jgi:hypothetical protein